jgi:hypothetical protein
VSNSRVWSWLGTASVNVGGSAVSATASVTCGGEGPREGGAGSARCCFAAPARLAPATEPCREGPEVASNAQSARRRRTGVMRMVEMISCILRVDSISEICWAGFRSVAISVTSTQVRMPVAEIMRGNIMPGGGGVGGG